MGVQKSAINKELKLQQYINRLLLKNGSGREEISGILFDLMAGKEGRM